MAVVVQGYDYRDVGGRAMQGAIAEAYLRGIVILLRF